MTKAVDLGRKATKNKKNCLRENYFSDLVAAVINCAKIHNVAMVTVLCVAYSHKYGCQHDCEFF